MSVARDFLWDGLQRRRKWTFDRKYFFSSNDVCSLFTREAIVAAVAEFVPDECESVDISSTIFRKGQKTFAILLWNRKAGSITNFIEHRALDADLPLEETLSQSIVPAFGKSFALDWQWPFLPCTLDYDMRLHHHFFRHELILPFVHQEKIGEGGFGEVFLTAVDSSQQVLTALVAVQAVEEGGFIPDLDVVQMEIGQDRIAHSVVKIVRKQFVLLKDQTQESRDRMIRNEMACLRVLGRLKHQNIIQMLGCYTYQDKRSILFPHIEMDLEAFLRLPDRFGEFIHDFTFLSALQGLASALSCVHNLKLKIETHGIELERIGYHHDFRPKNVLVNPRTFLLADFGLSKIKLVEDGSRTNWKAGAPDYLAPECTDMESHPQEVGRAIDMWAFGCTVAEIVTYMKNGPNGITRFRQNRLSPGAHPRIEDQCFHNGRELKPAVRDWFRILLGEPFSAYAEDLVDLSVSMLVVDAEKRLKCPELCKKLSFLCAKSHVTLALEDMELLIEQMKASSEPSDGPPIMELWFERERLKVWAAVFGLAGDSTWLSGFDKAEIGDQNVERLRWVFRKMLNRVQLELNKYNLDPHYTDTRKSIAIDVPVIEEIRGLVQDLWELLSPRKKSRAQFLWLTGALDTQDIGRLHSLELRKPVAVDNQYSEISALAAIKGLLLQFESNLGSGRTSALLAERDVRIVEHFGRNEIGTYQDSTKVFIEVLCYDKRWEGMKVQKRAERMQLVAEGLYQSEELPKLRIPNCIGFIPMKNAFGFLYPFPTNTDVPTTLLSLLDAKSASIPALEARIRLANTLVLCLAELHTVGWLHRNLNSDNIIFFSTPDCSIEKAIEDPYVIGLSTARPDSDLWSSWGPDDSRLVDYCHPEYGKKRRFQAIYDYYSLGIILLEIGLWRPVHSITSKWPTASPEAIQTTLIEKYVKQLRSQMGSAYYGAVLACMNGCSTSDGEREDLATSHMNFYDKVVDVLDRMSQFHL